jgi:hypothetical protein
MEIQRRYRRLKEERDGEQRKPGAFGAHLRWMDPVSIYFLLFACKYLFTL